MKRIIVAFVAVCCWCASACADCATGYFAVGGDCVESKFTVTTTELAADTTFAFYMSPIGTFYVDWGDGTVDTIARTDTDETLYDHTYSTAGIKTIRFGGIATEYNTGYGTIGAIRFYGGTPEFVGAISGNLSAMFPIVSGDNYSNRPRYINTFRDCTALTSIPETLFGVLRQSVAYQFYGTFYGCTGLTSIPENLFAGLPGIGGWGFANTFAYCTGLTSVPGNLFANIHNCAQAAFNGTFLGCTGITSIPENLFAGLNNCVANSLMGGTFQSCAGLTSIPENLFSHIVGSADFLYSATFMDCTGLTSIPKNLFNNINGAAKYLFHLTFSGCTNLSGYIPPELFAGLNGETAAHMFTDTFRNTNLYTSCPCGTTQYETGYESAWSGKVSCTVGLKPNEHWYNGTCATVCAAGVTEMKTSTGLSVPLITTKLTTPSINVAYNGSTCFIPLAVGAAANAINMSWDETTYHTVLPDDITPTGFTGQPY